MSAGDMRRAFADRADLETYLRQAFPRAAAIDDALPERPVGGRQAAEAQLAQIAPAAYATSRNHLDGAVTRLSPYLRHGVLTLAEVRDAALAAVADPRDAAKLISELGWRDYYQRVYAADGDAVWRDREPYKTGFDAAEYAADLPDEIQLGQTGTALDPFCRQLTTTGYLHNHARLWLAAYIVHWRRIRWQAGARWFLTHLLDGDPASNNLSWQWVASTFSQKPYIFNRDNLRKYGADLSAHPAADCPFNDSYENLAARLFPRLPAGR